MEENINEEDGEKVLKAYLELTKHFSEYVKEMDPVLWKKAVDYAKTFTKVEGITLYYEGEKNED